MSKWFETIVPADRTWSTDLMHPRKELKKGSAMDIARYLSTVLERTNDPALDNDNFTAIVNIKNGFIPINGDYSGFSIQIEGTVMGEYVNKTVLGDNNPITTEYVWYFNSLTFFVNGRSANDHTKETVIDAGSDWIMRITTHGNEWDPGNGQGARYGPYWADHAEFNPKITPASLASIKAALNNNPGEEVL